MVERQNRTRRSGGVVSLAGTAGREDWKPLHTYFIQTGLESSLEGACQPTVTPPLPPYTTFARLQTPPPSILAGTQFERTHMSKHYVLGLMAANRTGISGRDLQCARRAVGQYSRHPADGCRELFHDHPVSRFSRSSRSRGDHRSSRRSRPAVRAVGVAAGSIGGTASNRGIPGMPDLQPDPLRQGLLRGSGQILPARFAQSRLTSPTCTAGGATRISPSFCWNWRFRRLSTSPRCIRN